MGDPRSLRGRGKVDSKIKSGGLKVRKAWFGLPSSFLNNLSTSQVGFSLGGSGISNPCEFAKATDLKGVISFELHPFHFPVLGIEIVSFRSTRISLDFQYFEQWSPIPKIVWAIQLVLKRHWRYAGI